MYRRADPRFRRTLNEISQTIESANETAQSQLFVISHQYINPCLNGVYSCFQPCVEHCFPPSEERARRNRLSRGRAELNFDFYDDWEDDETDGLLGLGDDEYDSLLGSGSGGGYGTDTQPGRQRAMSYGTRLDAKNRRKSGIVDANTETTGVPGSSYFGFFGKLTGKIGGGKVLKYRPSAANLQEHPGETRKFLAPEGEPLMEESEGDGLPKRKRGRARSGTVGSGHTSDSLSSRGDLFPSEDEADALELDDEFAMVLERRTTLSGPEDESSGKSRSKKRPGAGSRKSTGTLSSRSTRNSKRFSRAESTKSVARSEVIDAAVTVVPSMTELKQEEEQAQIAEETAVARRREAAQRLAADRGLDPISPQELQASDADISVQSISGLASPSTELQSPQSMPQSREDSVSEVSKAVSGSQVDDSDDQNRTVHPPETEHTEEDRRRLGGDA